MIAGALLLALAVDGGAALDHAAAITALGPRPLGSPRTAVAAAYVAQRLGALGLEVRVQELRVGSARATNVIGVRTARRSARVVVVAHHDTVPDSPGAYDSACGVGVLLELARASADARTSHTLEFVSLGAVEHGAGGPRAYVESLGARRGDIVAAVVLDGCGWSDGAPVLVAAPSRDPFRPGRTLPVPVSLIAALGKAGAALPVGDARAPWLFQPTASLFEISGHVGREVFAAQGVTALAIAESSPTARYPWHHGEADTLDRLDRSAVDRFATAAARIVEALTTHEGALDRSGEWFMVSGTVVSRGALWVIVALATLAGAVLRAGDPIYRLARVAHAALALILLWRHPVAAAWTLPLPIICGASTRHRLASFVIAQLPWVAVSGFALTASGGGGDAGTAIVGSWLAPWEFIVFALALVLPWLRAPARRGAKSAAASR